MRLGKHQLCLLATMASPFNVLIVGDKVSRSLIKRGLFASHFAEKAKAEGFHGITPAGLRELADAMERGELEQFLDPSYRRDTARLAWNIKAQDETA